MSTQKLMANGFKGLVTTSTIAMLVACGGGGSDDDSATSEPVVARGVITQLGSIWVGGVEYETPDGGSYSDDDSTSSIANYKVGQVVSIRGRRNSDGISGTATEIEYEAEIEGIASGGAIRGVTIVLTPKTNSTEATLSVGGDLIDSNRYEVSGIWIDSMLEATYVKDDDDGDGEDEIKGYVKNDGASSFDVHGITFNWTGTPDVFDDDFVEVHFSSCIGTAPVTCTATRVELEDDYLDQAEGMEVEIEGAVNLDTTGCPPDANFKIDNTCIDWDLKPAVWLDGLTGSGDVVNGSRVEAEGHVIAGVSPMADLLVAEKIKGRGNRVRVSSIAGNVIKASPCTFQLVQGKISVTILDCVNAFEGDHSTLSVPLDIDNLLGEEVEVRGVRTGTSSMMALRVKADGLSSNDRHEIRAEVDQGSIIKTDDDTMNDTLSVMGIVSIADSNTELEVDDLEIAPGNGITTAQDIFDFLLMVDDNADASDGPRDTVEIGIDVTVGNGSTLTPYIADEWEIEEEDD